MSYPQTLFSTPPPTPTHHPPPTRPCARANILLNRGSFVTPGAGNDATRMRRWASRMSVLFISRPIGQIFLRYLSDRFKRARAAISQEIPAGIIPHCPAWENLRHSTKPLSTFCVLDLDGGWERGERCALDALLQFVELCVNEIQDSELPPWELW